MIYNFIIDQLIAG